MNVSHDEIILLPAGKWLDGLVARHIMGWQLDHLNPKEWLEQEFCGYITLEGWRPQGNFMPSIHIPDAWDVTEDMHVRGYWCQMRTPFGTGEHDDGYWAGFTPHLTTGWNGKPDNWTQAQTLPLAICRAALLAVLGDKT